MKETNKVAGESDMTVGPVRPTRHRSGLKTNVHPVSPEWPPWENHSGMLFSSCKKQTNKDTNTGVFSSCATPHPQVYFKKQQQQKYITR